MLIQIKSSKNNKGLVVFDHDGEFQLCANADELWTAVDEMEARDEIVALDLPGVMVVQLEIGDSEVVVAGEDGQPTTCRTKREFWDCLSALTAPTPSPETKLAPRRTPVQTIVTDVEIVEDGEDNDEKADPGPRTQSERELEFVRDVATGLGGSPIVGDIAAGLLKRGRRLSFRGKRGRRFGRKRDE